MKKLTGSLILAVIFAVIGFGWLVGQLYFRFEANSTDQNSQLVGYRELGRHLANTLDNAPNRDWFVERWRSQGGLQLSVQPRSDFPLPLELLPDFERGEALTLRSGNKLSMHFNMPVSGQVMTLEVAGEIVPNQPQVINLILTLLFYLGVVVIVLIWLYPLIRRLARLRGAAHAFGLGDMSSRVDLSRASYISDIEAEFNRMADRIQTLIADNKLLSKAVSHDLKTPLARLRFGLDTIEDTKDESLKRKYFQRINNDLDEMDGLVNTLLQYARLDEANIQIKRREIQLKPFLEGILVGSEYPSIIVERDFTEACAVIESDEDYLALQINNLMSNALKNARSKVLVRLTVIDKEVAIAIEDDGDGIPAEQRSEAVKPFWRGNNTTYRGHGMGLAIVSRIAEWLDSELEIADSERLGGAAIFLRFRAC